MKLAVAAAVFGVVLSGCGDDGGGNETDDGITIGSPGGDDEGGDDEGGTDESGSGTSNSGDLMVVWPLPEGDFEVWLPYQLIDDSFQYAESASFSTTSVTVEQLLEFYRDYFPTIGLMTNEFPAGDSTAMNLTDPLKPGWSGVTQIGRDVNGLVIVNQNYTDLLDQATTTTEAPESEVVDEGTASDG